MVDISSECEGISAREDIDDLTKETAASLSRFEKGRTQKAIELDQSITPDKVLPVDHEFAAQYADVTCEGATIAARSKVVFVGMARQIGGILPMTLGRILDLSKHFKSTCVVIVENDSTDSTKEILSAFAAENPKTVVVDSQDLGRPHLRGFEPNRVQAYAEYRNRGRELAKEHLGDADYVIVVDLDAWGGWSAHGLINGIGWLDRIKDAACMASTSLFQHPGNFVDGKQAWCHYDQWAFRWHGWKARMEAWFTFWLPPPGAHPIRVLSAFGAAAIYKAEPFFACKYESVDGDIEHSGLHRNMIEKGWSVWLNPAQRTLMHWMPETNNGGRDGNH